MKAKRIEMPPFALPIPDERKLADVVLETMKLNMQDKLREAISKDPVLRMHVCRVLYRTEKTVIRFYSANPADVSFEMLFKACMAAGIIMRMDFNNCHALTRS